MSSPKVLMGFILLDLKFPVSWERGGGANPTKWTNISRASGILKGPVVQKLYWPIGPVNFFSYVDP